MIALPVALATGPSVGRRLGGTGPMRKLRRINNSEPHLRKMFELDTQISCALLEARGLMVLVSAGGSKTLYEGMVPPRVPCRIYVSSHCGRETGRQHGINDCTVCAAKCLTVLSVCFAHVKEFSRGCRHEVGLLPHLWLTRTRPIDLDKEESFLEYRERESKAILLQRFRD
jgi:hypothetical protein